MSLTCRIGANIRRLRERRQMTQQRLATEADVSLSLVNWIEVGKRDNVTIKTLEKLARVLDTTVEALIK